MEVLAERHSAVVVDDDETVIGLLLRVLVDQTATERSHLLAVQGTNFGEDTRLDFVAAILRVLHLR